MRIPALVTMLALASPARADDGDQLTLPAGRLILDGFVEASLSKGEAFQPVSLSPDLWYGATDKLTLGLVHSTWGETGFVGTAGDSLCLTGSSNGCAHVYNAVALDARYALATGSFAWALDGGLDVRSFASPFQLAVKLGAVGRWHKDKLAIELEPELFFGLTNRGPMMGTPNKDTFAVPVTLLYSVAPKVTLAAQTGLILPLESTSATYSIPLSLGAHYRVSDPFDLGLAFTLGKLIGGGDSGFDIRSLTLGGTYAF